MAINISEVSFAYDISKKKNKTKYVLNNVNLNIDEKGEFIAIVGHTGSGKSTLVQLLNALLIPTCGSVSISGKVISKKTKEKLNSIRKEIGLVFQFPEYQLFEETVLKDVAFGPKNFGEKDYIEKAKEALKIVGIDEKMYETSPFSLSGGQMRRVSIAGILASSPNVLIFDEPTVGLDPLSRRALMELLVKINKEENKTIIVITHDMDVVSEYAKRVIVLDQGHVVFDGKKEDLFRNEQLLKTHNLDYPNYVKILREIKEKLNIDIDVYQYNLLDSFSELKKVLGEKHE